MANSVSLEPGKNSICNVFSKFYILIALSIFSLAFSLITLTFLLRDILHKCALFFLKSFESQEISLLKEFSSHFCVIKDRITLVPLLKAPLQHGIYSLTLPSPIHLPSPQAYLGERVSAAHCQFFFRLIDSTAPEGTWQIFSISWTQSLSGIWLLVLCVCAGTSYFHVDKTLIDRLC